ncbi:MAG: hypothetical protein KC503_23540, partial [Myxococcales bacterium]|nr:hypothetical protein [Myxococcales bacterium]
SWLDHEKRTFSFGRGSGLDVQVVAASPTRSAPGPRMLGHTTRRSAITLDLQVRDVRLARALELVVWHTRDATLVDHRRALLGVVLPHLSGGVARDLRRRLAGELGFPLAWQLTLRASPAAVSRIIGKGGRAAAFGAFGALLPLTIKVAVKRVTPTNVRLQDFELSPRDYTQR